MPLPTIAEQQGFELTFNGFPQINTTGTSSIVADGSEFIVNGFPCLAVSPSGGVVYNATQFFMFI